MTIVGVDYRPITICFPRKLLELDVRFLGFIGVGTLLKHFLIALVEEVVTTGGCHRYFGRFSREEEVIPRDVILLHLSDAFFRQ
jgi:hypothetical protein